MTTLAALLAQKADLERQIAEARKSETAAAITKARAIVAEYGLVESDVFGKSRMTPQAPGTVVAKYRDPATGKTWSGRGKAPLWIAGKDRTAFAI
ncbi:MAG: H-NS histone family protein [Acidovorax sp.]